jgi:transcriptional regulator with XRE-family HTH domain
MKRSQILAAFGRKVRLGRISSHLTQEQLAEKAGLHPTYISGIERGVRNPSLLIVARIADGLGASASELLAGVGE